MERAGRTTMLSPFIGERAGRTMESAGRTTMLNPFIGERAGRTTMPNLESILV